MKAYLKDFEDLEMDTGCLLVVAHGQWVLALVPAGWLFHSTHPDETELKSMGRCGKIG